MFTGNHLAVGCYDGDLGYTDMWSVDMWRSDRDRYRTEEFNYNACLSDCYLKPFIGIVSTYELKCPDVVYLSYESDVMCSVYIYHHIISSPEFVN